MATKATLDGGNSNGSPRSVRGPSGSKAGRKKKRGSSLSPARRPDDPAAPDVRSLERSIANLSRKDPLNWTSRLGPVGEAIEEWRSAMIDDLGGEDTVSAMERVVVDMSAKLLVQIDVIDHYIFDPDSQRILDLENERVRFIVMQRKVLADSLERYMRDLGLKKRQKPPKPIGKVLEELAETHADSLDEETLEAVRELPDDPMVEEPLSDGSLDGSDEAAAQEEIVLDSLREEVAEEKARDDAGEQEETS